MFNHQKIVALSLLAALVLTMSTIGLAGAALPLPQDGGTVYTVQAADSLNSLAEKYYGDSANWPVIWLATNARAAEDDTFEVITNPNVLRVGQSLWIPDAEEASQWMTQYLEEKQAELAAAPKTMRLPDLGGRTVVAVTENAYTPLNFVDPDTGQAVGWEYDAVNEICRRLNCQVDWQLSSWDTMISAVQNGQFDVGMDGITITDERKEQVDFSNPYMVSQQFMLVRADEDRFTTPEEFGADPELLIGSQTGTTNFYVAVYEVLDGDEANPRIKLFENFGAAVQALIGGDVDMVLTDAASSQGYIGANPDKLKIVGEPLGTEEFGFIFTPGSELVDPFNKAIATMEEDGFIEQLNNRWFFLYDPSAGAAQEEEEAAPSQEAVSETQVIVFTPADPGEDGAQEGNCWTSSLAVVGREDAWRCMIDNSIYDPCFAISENPDFVVCDADPSTDAPGFRLKLTEPLPAPDVTQASEADAWMFELADGMMCSMLTGATGVIDDKRINYGCTPEYSILGDLIPNGVWQAERVVVEVGDDGWSAKESKMVDVAIVWK